MMKNSANKRSVIAATTQDLRAQAAQLLPTLTATISALGYYEISHQRISQQSSYQDNYQYSDQGSYQGLTRAQHKQFGKVMLKWQLSADDGNNCNNWDKSKQSTSTLSHEIAMLQTLNNLQPIQAHNNTATLSSIAPPIFANHSLAIKVFERQQCFTMLVMPYYALGSLAQQLNNKNSPLSAEPLTDKQKQQFIISAAELIANLHHSGLLHNDIKPSNILLEGFLSKGCLLNGCLLNKSDGGEAVPRLLLTDFALASHFEANAYQNSTVNPAGTPAYLAPERWQGQSATPQSDIYAFGIIIYEILVGKRPFNITLQSSQRLKDWAIEHCQTPIPASPNQYQHYQLLINKALAKRVESRYQNMQQVLQDLEGLNNK
jgi:serine/threonine-protein kinase